MRYLSRLWIIVMVMIWPIQAMAATAMHQLQVFMSSVHAASGTFTQTTTSEGASQFIAQPPQRGAFSFQRPGKFKWEVEKPYRQLIISNGQQVYQYDPDLLQVAVRQVNQAIGTSPAAILFGSDSLAQSFDISPLPERSGVAWLRAKPRHTDAGFARVDIGFKDNLPVCLELFDAFGQITRVALAAFVKNPKFSAEAFQFKPPQGVAVVHM